jgi:hypothetical protein
MKRWQLAISLPHGLLLILSFFEVYIYHNMILKGDEIKNDESSPRDM